MPNQLHDFGHRPSNPHRRTTTRHDAEKKFLSFIRFLISTDPILCISYISYHALLYVILDKYNVTTFACYVHHARRDGTLGAGRSMLCLCYTVRHLMNDIRTLTESFIRPHLAYFHNNIIIFDSNLFF